MKNTGVVRKVDQLGRVVLPKELRDNLNIHESEPMEIFVDQENIILQKFKKTEACLITGEISEQNIKLSNDIVLSPEGVRLLLEELAQRQ
ncbi:AbrB/MazE/SpoVT family DNA-binding domain-containing protein (plasmid) [Bacillus sp. JNUCC-24]|uniref:AbrB/MazE/SpoVT family DNA-binding domain-containing protein n=1 Tax=Bacillus sp. JNUCC-24 TaxID=2842458 RepID=UPI001C0C2211|nr:AbrB/MazE/SpoVT family DNA-binding domain-containing protein [Bacillus sp. JNUCC-24]QWS52484.1 AbrB/MazE/SpoVT family DNA-binding domain-containing protein [Bacillus sp. JNUCC-24]